MNLLPRVTSFSRRPAMGAETLLLVPITGIAAGLEVYGLPAGALGVGALACGGWMLGRVLSRRREPHSAEV
jgi:hypothetical protein